MAVGRLPETELVRPRRGRYAHCGLALVAERRCDAELAQEQYSNLLSQRGTAPLFLGGLTVDRVLGVLSRTMGRQETAIAHFADGLAFCSRARYRPELAWTAWDYADALLARSGPGDAQRAADLRAEALALARALEMGALIDRLASEGPIA